MSVSTAEVAEPTAATNAAAATPNHQLLVRTASPNVQVLEATAAAAAQARHQFELLLPPAECAMLSASRSA